MLLNRCVYCDGELQPFRSESLSYAYDEIGLSSNLRSENFFTLSSGKCKSCASIVANDIRMSGEVDILDVYTHAPSTYVYSDEAFQANLPFYKKVEQLINLEVDHRTICDVGCNSGQFLRSLNESWDKFGVEPGLLALQLLEDQSIQVHQGTLENSKFPKKSMDCITYFDVFEHLLNPIEEIEIAKKFLKNDGKLVILTGNSTSMTAKAAGPTWTYLSYVGHVAVPSEKALRKTLSLSGFTKIEIFKLSHPYSRNFIDWMILLILSKLLGSPARIKFFKRIWTVPLLRDHMLIIASLE